ncbi:hypothetical protein AAFX91_08300 [Bradyrhizobium sp. 31Argb]|uniref:helix-turn-helix transcriptional regulator n=1 Tax=Bradyrhizobium sp. 31Argb TaxID=3141247 RepID=UPI00374A5BD2
MIEAKAEVEVGAQDQLREMMIEPEVLALTKMSRTTLHRMEKAGMFPAGVYIAPNTKRWWRDQIVGWQKALAEHDHFNPNRGRGKGRRQRQRVSSDASQSERAG